MTQIFSQYVKMVHNGIEYGDMQLICEAYDIMKRGLGLKEAEIADIFETWNKGVLDSFLIEIVSGNPIVISLFSRSSSDSRHSSLQR